MKYIKWKILIITCLICLLPISFGVAVWSSLPDTVAIHFDFNGNADGFASKNFAVLGFPVLMMFVQCFCCIVHDIKTRKLGQNKMFERVTKWIIPTMSVILQVLILGYSLEWQLDMRVAVALIVGAVLIAVGYSLSGLDYVNNYNINAEKAKKINRFVGFETIIMGVLFILSTLFPPIFTVGCLFLFIPYAVTGLAYGIKVERK